MHEANVLVPDNFDLVDESEAAQIIPQLLLSQRLLEPTQVDIPTCVALTDRKSDLSRHGRRLSPADFELLSMESQFLDRSVRVERSSGRAIQERQENAGFLWEDTDRLQGTKVHQIEELVDGGGRREVADIDCTSSGVSRRRKGCSQGDRRIGRLGRWDVERRKALLGKILQWKLKVQRVRSS